MTMFLLQSFRPIAVVVGLQLVLSSTTTAFQRSSSSFLNGPRGRHHPSSSSSSRLKEGGLEDFLEVISHEKVDMTPDDVSNTRKVVSIDHLVYVVPDLLKAMDELEEKTGVRPAMGGRHLTLGTHNAFISMGEGRYLELFAPDPEAEVPLQKLIGVDGPKPRLSTYCCDAGRIGLDYLVDHKFTSLLSDPDMVDVLPTEVEAGSRTNAKDGSTISWRIAVEKHAVPSEELPMGGLLPFYIDWGVCRNVRPATTAPTGCVLKTLRAIHPQADKLKSMVGKLNVGLQDLLDIQQGPEPKLVAIIDTPKGTIELS